MAKNLMTVPFQSLAIAFFGLTRRTEITIVRVTFMVIATRHPQQSQTQY
jgi:hypothetical protein